LNIHFSALRRMTALSMFYRMKRTMLMISLFSVTLSLHAQTNAPRPKMTVQIDGYAAKVNDHVITRGDVNRMVVPLLADLYKRFQGAQFEGEKKKLYDQAREQLIEQALIIEAFKRRGGQIPDQYVNEEIERVIRTRYNGEASLFEQSLAEERMTRQEYMDRLRDQMSVGMMTNEEVNRRARVTPEQVRLAYENEKETYYIPEKIQHSVIMLNKGETAADQQVKRAEAEAIRARLLAGEDFNVVAKEVSEGSRAADGGKFPWLQPKDIREELASVMNQMRVGDISEVIETDMEFYIVKVDARRNEGYHPFDEVRKAIKDRLLKRERERLYTRWIERLRQENFVVVYD
jgi:peptidyl-prolyl cis-trans isomerase SurA